MKRKKLSIDGNKLNLDLIEQFLEGDYEISLTKKAESKILRSRKLIESWIENDEIIYGVTTGFGEFSNIKISKDKLEEWVLEKLKI